MKKLTLFRESGSPVDPTLQEAYQEEYRTFYDKCEAKADKIFQKNTGVLNRRLVPKMIILQRLLQYGERSLMRKYSGSNEVELPKSAKGWSELLARYHDTPIMIAKRSDGKGIVLVLMDAYQG